MPEGSVFSDRLDSWKEIASYINRSVRTVIRWEIQKGLPVHRIPGGERHSVFAYRHEIDKWMHNGGTGLSAEASRQVVNPPSAEPENSTADRQTPPVNAARAADPSQSTGAKPRVWIAVGLAVCTLTLIAAVFWLRWLFPSGFRNDEQKLISDGSLPAFGSLVAAGGNLYFGLYRNGHTVLATMAETGGPISEIATPFIQVRPVGVIPGGKSVLALAVNGRETERPLWAVPTDGSKLSRVGHFLCHAAALSPDGKTIAYAFGTSVYLASDHGEVIYLLHTFSGIPTVVRWSLDGSRILAMVQDNAEGSVIWKLLLAQPDHRSLVSLIRATRGLHRYDTVSPVVDDRDDAFLTETDDGHPMIYSLLSPRLPWIDHAEAQPFLTKDLGGSDLAADQETHTLFYFRSTVQQDELNRLDLSSGQSRPFLPGVSAHDVDFSRDGKRIAYVTDPRRPSSTLWVSGSDGSGAVQVDTSGMTGLELPRWSPDGKVLAFMGRYLGHPWRVYLVSAAGNRPREAGVGTDNQGAPTWSPDGKSIIYGRVLCDEEKLCAIMKIDLATGQETEIPGSEGLSTARWSPDGQYIAALRSDREQVVLLDRRTGVWRVLADGVNGDDLAWTRDSRTLYASNPDGNKPEILRVSLSGQPETAVDLSAYSHLPGRVDTWFAVAPDGSILFTRVVQDVEIVAAHYVNE